MANFMEKMGEKLHMGGNKKVEGEAHDQHAAYEGQHPPHAGDHKEHCEPHGSHPADPVYIGGEHHSEAGHAYAEPLGSHPGPVYGTEAGHAGYGGVHEQQHGEQLHGTGAVPPPQHGGPFQKVKNKVKGQKHDGKEDDSSSSSSSESDGEGGRRKKKLGIF